MDIFGILDPDPHENLCGSETLVLRSRSDMDHQNSDLRSNLKLTISTVDSFMKILTIAHTIIYICRSKKPLKISKTKLSTYV